MDWTSGLQAYNMSSPVVSRVCKTYNYNDIFICNRIDVLWLTNPISRTQVTSC